MVSSPIRPDLFVVVRILESLGRAGAPLGKTRLQGAAGTNYTVFSRYLELLLERGLVESIADDGGTESLRLTKKGFEALRFLSQGIDMVLRAGGPDPS
ncbi:MAG: winged helix-turn-helix domain-containing protein [Thermoplasmata archaeon]|nr:winged helix-turn-helix domain-containing protein [Thermoplasmata archaeon]